MRSLLSMGQIRVSRCLASTGVAPNLLESHWPEEIMQMPAIDIDVLIIGAGPVGLFLANECARRSLRWRLIEQRPRQSEHSKALAVMPRTLEIFDMAGVDYHGSALVEGPGHRYFDE